MANDAPDSPKKTPADLDFKQAAQFCRLLADCMAECNDIDELAEALRERMREKRVSEMHINGELFRQMSFLEMEMCVVQFAFDPYFGS